MSAFSDWLAYKLNTQLNDRERACAVAEEFMRQVLASGFVAGILPIPGSDRRTGPATRRHVRMSPNGANRGTDRRGRRVTDHIRYTDLPRVGDEE